MPQRREYETYLRTGRRLPSACGSEAAPESKFNRNHDPENGQFTSGPGAEKSGGEIVVTARRPHPAPAAPVTPVKGSFKRRANEVGIDGEVADALNRLIENPNASVGITLGGVPVTITRTDPDAAHVSGSLEQSFNMEGKFNVVPGQEAVVISGLDPGAPTSHFPSFMTVRSFPSKIRIARDDKRRMTYNLDKAVIATTPIGFGPRQAAGTYYFRR